MIRGRIVAGLAAVLMAGVGACEPSYESVTVRRVAGSPDAEIDGQRMSVPEGALVVFKSELEASRGDYDALDRVRFESRDPSVAQVIQGIRAGRWMLLGTAQGSTELAVFVNGELEDTLSVDVVPAPQEGEEGW
ncbi:MAG: hypothetical protein AB1Z98_12905 [Nannocystaceae bacterium]